MTDEDRIARLVARWMFCRSTSAKRLSRRSMTMTAPLCGMPRRKRSSRLCRTTTASWEAATDGRSVRKPHERRYR